MGRMASPTFEWIIRVEFNPRDELQRRYTGYGLSKLPNSLDHEVSDFVDLLMASDAGTVAGLVLTDSGRSVLRAFAERMSSLAVRREDTSLLPRALLAIVLGGLARGERDALMVMSLIDAAATRLGTEIAVLCQAIFPLVGDQGVQSLAEWLARAPADRSIAAMGYVESTDSNGLFTFKRDW